jgi:hypothetical protein
VEVSSEDISADSALAAVLSVVAEAGDDASERLNALAQIGAPAVILEADERRPIPFDDDIADEALRLRARVSGVQIEDPSSWQLLTFGRAVEAAHKLVAAAHGEYRYVALHGFRERFTLHLHEVDSHPALFPVLRAAYENEIVVLWDKLVLDLQLADLEPDIALLATALQAEYVAAVAIDVHLLRVEMRDAER